MARARSVIRFGTAHRSLRAVVGRRLPNDERLRRLVPLLLACFVAVALIGFTLQLIQGKRAALGIASQQLSLIADNTALNLKDKGAAQSTRGRAP